LDINLLIGIKETFLTEKFLVGDIRFVNAKQGKVIGHFLGKENSSCVFFILLFQSSNHHKISLNGYSDEPWPSNAIRWNL